MKFRIPLSILCATAIAANAYELSGTVTDASGHGIAGVWVGLAQAKLATKTASNGSWSLNGVSGIVARSSHRTQAANHLVLVGGRLNLSLSGKDIAGRVVAQTTTTSTSTAAPRSADAIADTLYFVGNREILLASAPVAQSTSSAIATTVDTSISFPITAKADTLFINESKYADAYCGDSTLYIDADLEQYTDTNIVSFTSGGIELQSLGDDEDGGYLDITKFTRLSGTSGTLAGTYKLAGSVLRAPSGTVVADSVRAIFASDSAISAQEAAIYGYTYRFASDSIRLTGRTSPAPARQFLFNWNSTYDQWWYDSYDSSWQNDEAYSDSARYDIATTLKDSNTVTLHGNTTKETATVVGALAQNAWGYDYAFSSSDASHAAATEYAMPTTCPNGPTWYSGFLSGNGKSTTESTSAARKLARTVARPVRRISLFSTTSLTPTSPLHR